MALRRSTGTSLGRSPHSRLISCNQIGHDCFSASVSHAHMKKRASTYFSTFFLRGAFFSTARAQHSATCESVPAKLSRDACVLHPRRRPPSRATALIVSIYSTSSSQQQHGSPFAAPLVVVGSSASSVASTRRHSWHTVIATALDL